MTGRLPVLSTNLRINDNGVGIELAHTHSCKHLHWTTQQPNNVQSGMYSKI